MNKSNDNVAVTRSWKSPRLTKVSIKEITRGGFGDMMGMMGGMGMMGMMGTS